MMAIPMLCFAVVLGFAVLVLREKRP
jgi:FHS family L-fucose permease-like MFS transporter